MHPHCKILISTDLFKVGDCQLCNNTSGIIFHRSYSFMTKSWDTRIKINNKRDFFMFYTSTCCPKDIWIDCSFCSAKWKGLSYWKSCKVECCTNIANAKVIFYPLKICSLHTSSSMRSWELLQQKRSASFIAYVKNISEFFLLICCY